MRCAKIYHEDISYDPYDEELATELDMAANHLAEYCQYLTSGRRITNEHMCLVHPRDVENVHERSVVRVDYAPLNWIGFIGMGEEERAGYVRMLELWYGATVEMMAAMFGVPVSSMAQEIDALSHDTGTEFRLYTDVPSIDRRWKWNEWLNRYGHRSGRFKRNGETLGVHPYNSYKETKRSWRIGRGRFTLRDIVDDPEPPEWFDVDAVLAENECEFDALLVSLGI